MIRHLPWFLVALMGLMLLWVPLPFGSVTPWATAILEVSAFVLLALALVRARSLSYFRPVLGPALVLGAIAAFGVLQALPWPPALVEVVSPAHAELYRQSGDLAGAAGAAGAAAGAEAAPHLSLAPDLTKRTALLWAAWAALLAAAAVAGRHALHRRVLFSALLLAAGFQIVYGMQRWLGGVSTIWEIPVPGAPDRLRGTFVNPDHFALFLELALAVSFAWIWWASRRWSRLRSLETRLLWVVPPSILWIGLFAALAFSGSRAGLLAALVGLAVQTALLLDSRRFKTTLLLGGGVLAAGLVTVMTLGARYGFGRFLETSAYELTWGARIQAFEASLGLWGEYLWLGTGLGTFQDAFPLVQPSGLKGRWLHAHSDILELGVTTGILGFGIFAVGVVLLLRRLLTLARHGLRSEDRAAAVAALGALAAAGAHEAVDFGLTMPANAFALAVICGAACGARLAPASGRRERARFQRRSKDPGEATRNRPGTNPPPASFSTSRR